MSYSSWPFPLVDVTAMPDEHILTHRRVAVLELVQKHIRTRDMLEISQAIGNLLNAWHLELDVVRTLLQYIFQQGNTSQPSRFLDNIAAQAASQREGVMTIAQEFRSEGIQIGLSQGMKKGQKLAALNIARQLIDKGIDPVIVKQSTGLSEHERGSLAK